MSERFDVIVIGGGHNGLTAAAALARRGRRVVVVERSDRPGGVAAPEEFHPGYRAAGLLHDTTGVRPCVIRGLDLTRHGLRLVEGPPELRVLEPDGADWVLPCDIERRAASDAGPYRRFRAWLDGLRPVLSELLDSPPVDLLRFESIGKLELARRALKLRRLGRQTLSELARLPPMPVADWLDEWFESDGLKAALALPAVDGGFNGPRAPGTVATLLRHELLAGPRIRGGGAALVAALEGAARAAGVTIRSGCEVAEVRIGDHAARGVVLASGETIEAPRVAASCDPAQLFLRLLPRGAVEHRTLSRIRKFRARGVTAQVLLALDRPPDLGRGVAGAVALARTGGNLDTLERAFDAVKYRTCASDPLLDVYVPTADAPELAPPGHAVMSLRVHGAPFELETGWTDEARERLADRSLETLERHCPGIGASVVARVVRSPVDLESRFALPSGHAFHGEHALDQLLVRPVPDCVGYGTPVDGLFVCGSGSHPGGGLTCGPGWLAAQRILAAG